MLISKTEEKQTDIFTKHRGPVTSVAQIGNGPWILTSAYDGAVAQFNVESGEVKLLGYHRHLVNRIVVHLNGKKAASCSSDYSIGIWDLETGELERYLLGHNDDVEDFIFVNENTGVSASRDRRVLIWDLVTGTILRVIDGHEKDVLSLAYHNNYIYSTGDDKTLRVCDVNTALQINKWGPFEVETDTCAIDIAHERVVLGCDDGYIRIFSIHDGSTIYEVKAHTSGIKKVACSPLDGTILSAAYDQRIRVWNAVTFNEILELENIPSKWERSLIWSTDGSKILAGTFDGTVLVWESQSGKFIKEIGRAIEEHGNACFNEASILSENKVVTVSDDGYIRLIDFTNAFSQKYEPDSGRFLMNGIASCEDLVVGGAHNQKLHFYRFKENVLRYEKEVFLGEGPINTIRIATNPAQKINCFVGCYSGAIVRLDQDGEILNKFFVHDNAVKALRLHPKNMLGVSCSAGGELYSWDFNGNLQNKYFGHTAIINDVDINESGDRIASVSRDFTLKVYDFSSAQLVYSYSLGRRSLKSVCYFNDDTVVIGDYWGTLITIDIKSGKSITKKIANNGISSVNKMSNYIIASSYDGSIYQVEPNELLTVKKHIEMNQVINSNLE